MKQAGAAADQVVSGPQMNGDAERVMVTGLVVTYARPFSKSNTLGAVSGQIAKIDDERDRELHKWLCSRRDDLYAHNDMTEFRGVLDWYEMFGIGRGSYAEQYTSIGKAVLSRIADLAYEFERRFAMRVEEIEAELGFEVHFNADPDS